MIPELFHKLAHWCQFHQKRFYVYPSSFRSQIWILQFTLKVLNFETLQIDRWQFGTFVTQWIS